MSELLSMSLRSSEPFRGEEEEEQRVDNTILQGHLYRALCSMTSL